MYQEEKKIGLGTSAYSNFEIIDQKAPKTRIKNQKTFSNLVSNQPHQYMNINNNSNLSQNQEIKLDIDQPHLEPNAPNGNPLNNNSNNNINNNQNNNAEVQPVHIPMNRIMSKLYGKALDHFKCTNAIYFLFSIIKSIVYIIMVPIFSMKCQIKDQEILGLLLLIHGAIGVYYYYTIYSLSNQNQLVLEIAEDLHHVFYVQNNQVVGNNLEENQQDPLLNENNALNNDDLNQPILNHNDPENPNNNNYDNSYNPHNNQHNRQVTMLALQIKYEMKKRRQPIGYLGNLLFSYYQAVSIWGFYLLFRDNLIDVFYGYQFHEQQCVDDVGIVRMNIFTLIFGLTQYIDFYILLALLVLVLPFVIIYFIYDSIQKCNQRNASQVFADSLPTENFNPNKILGDHMCKICLDEYNESDSLIVLPCNDLHHFHSVCVKKWLQQNRNCPLCRHQFVNPNAQHQAN